MSSVKSNYTEVQKFVKFANILYVVTSGTTTTRNHNSTKHLAKTTTMCYQTAAVIPLYTVRRGLHPLGLLIAWQLSDNNASITEFSK